MKRRYCFGHVAAGLAEQPAVEPRCTGTSPP